MKSDRNELPRSAIWMEPTELTVTADIEKRCTVEFLTKILSKWFPEELITVSSAEINRTGVFDNLYAKSFPLVYHRKEDYYCTGLPAYCDVRITRKTPGNHTEQIIIWSPMAWNDRFMGTAGGGNQTGGVFHLNQPDNSERAMTVPVAVCNGFTAATTDAGNPDEDFGWKDNQLDWEAIQNWAERSTHWMTLIGKAVAGILHGRPPAYSYMVGASGGGRQSLVEVQNYPDDYDGVWAICPAVNWSKFLLGGLWITAVMAEYGNVLPASKLDQFRLGVHEQLGGSGRYYETITKINFDPYTLVGQETKDGPITVTDAQVMREIWDGPLTSQGERLWYSWNPGSQFWNDEGQPSSTIYYVSDGLGNPEPNVFPLVAKYAKWVLEDSSAHFEQITKQQFVDLFRISSAKFAFASAESTDLDAFHKRGGKLLLDQGTDDPLVPYEGIVAYYERLIKAVGSKEETRHFCRMFLNPGDGHGNCYTHGPGLTLSTGVALLMNWVEKGIAPETAEGILLNRESKQVLKKTTLHIY